MDTPRLLHAVPGSGSPMTDAQKRSYVSNLYPGPRWKKRVERMPDDQVAAIYLDHQNEGTKPEHNEDGLHILEPVVEELVEIKPDPGFENPMLGALTRMPSPPHENEDDFPTY
jgi:hypothetical protein